MTSEQKKIVTINHNLIYSYINSHNLNFEEYYDLLAIQLCKCAEQYDISKGCKFSTFVYACFDNVVKCELRKQSAACRIPKDCIFSIDTPISINEDGSELTIADKLFDEDNLENSLLWSDVQIFLKSLPVINQKIFYLYLNGNTQTTISKIVNKSQPQVHRIIKSIQALLRKEFNDD